MNTHSVSTLRRPVSIRGTLTHKDGLVGVDAEAIGPLRAVLATEVLGANSEACGLEPLNHVECIQAHMVVLTEGLLAVGGRDAGVFVCSLEAKRNRNLDD